VRQFTWIPDNNQNSYPNGQILFDGAALSNSGRWIDPTQSYMVIPLVLSVQGSFPVGANNAGNIENVFAASLKNGVHQLINSVAVEVTNNAVTNLTSFSNLDINYRLLTSMSFEDQQNFGGSIGFSKDTAESIEYSSAADARGLGEINNRITQTGVFSTAGGWGAYARSNQGRAQRMVNNTSFDPVNNTAQALFTSRQTCGIVGKNYCEVVPAAAPTNINYYVMATIPLKILHQVFAKMPLVRGSYWRIVVNLNTQCLSTLTVNAAGNYVSVATTSINNMVPYQISPLGAGNGLQATLPAGNATSTIQISLGVTRSFNTATSYAHSSLSQCRLYACLYEMAPLYEELYLKTNPVKDMHYTDILSFQVLNVASGSNFSQLLSNGISRMRYLLIHPMINTNANGTAGTANGAWATATNTLGLTSPQNSPFSSCPGTCAPQSHISNFNVLVSGTAIYQQAYFYKFEHWLQEIRQSNSLNGGVPLSLSSWLISQSDYENAYGWIYVDLSRRASQANDDISRSLQILGTNMANYAIDLYCIVGYERQISISTGTGSLVI